MRVSLLPYLSIALVGLVFVLWRSAASPKTGDLRAATGIILSKSYVKPTTYAQQPGGNRGSFLTPAEIPIAERFSLEIQLDDPPAWLTEKTIRASVNAVRGEQLRVGQKVSIKYKIRQSYSSKHISVYDVQ